MRTPLVETYIQDTRPDEKLYEVPVDDQYLLSRVDFGKALLRQELRAAHGGQEELLQGLAGRHHRADQAARSGKVHLLPHRLHADDVHRPLRLRPAALRFQLCAPGVSGHGAHLGLRRASRESRHGPLLWPHLGRGRGRQRGPLQRHLHRPHDEDSSKYYFHFDSWRMNVQPGIWLPVAVYVEESQRIEGSEVGRPEGANPLLGLFAQAAHARQRERQREGRRRGRQAATTRRTWVRCRPRACGSRRLKTT